jgi:hippurate hydrolase
MALLRAAFLASLLTAGSSFAAAEDLKSAIDHDYPSLEALYRDLHRHPELSGHEVETARKLAQEARAAGLTVTEHVGGNGLVAVLKNGPGPIVLLRTELDALPVEEQTGLPYASSVKTKNDRGEEVPVAHACGHDAHMTIWTGVARRLVAERSAWSGTLVMIAQPAEETAGGAKAMIGDGLFTRFPRPDFNLSLHDTAALPAGTVGYVRGPVKSAADSVDIDVRGIGGHGAVPQNTRDPIVVASAIVMALQTLVARNEDPFHPAVVTVGSFHGGSKHNIIASDVKLQLSVRSMDEPTRTLLLDGIKRIALGEARSFGIPETLLPVVTVVESTPVTVNSPDLIDRVVPALEGTLGKDHVVEGSPLMTSEDFSEYGRVEPKIPSAQLWLGAVNAELFAATPDKSKLYGTHSPQWAPDPEPTIKTGIETLTIAALTLMKKP